MNSEELREYFDRIASDYESVIQRLVPYYAKQNNLLMDLIPFQRQDSFMALDVGSGPGILSRLLLDTFPNARVMALDVSTVMLDLCKKKLWAYPNRASFRHGDFTSDALGGPFDVVLAGLVLHHAAEAPRRQFFRAAMAAMKPGGILLSRDIVRGSTARLTQDYERLWRLYMRAQGEDGEAWYAKFQAKDPPATVEDQLKSMTDAGFIDVGCHWRYLNFAITGGRKPG